MERVRWTDDRIDGQMAVIDARFERAFEEIRAMREEMRADFVAVRNEIAGVDAGVRSDIAGVRSDIAGLRGQNAGLRGDLAAFQRQMTHILAGFAIALLGVIATGVAAAVTAAV